jgi:O-antigen ligase
MASSSGGQATRSDLPLHWRNCAPALFFGSWAAAIAVAPTMAAKALIAAPAAAVLVAGWTLYRPARWVIAFFAAALLLPPLPIPLGDSGPHPCLLFAALGLAAGVLWAGEWEIRAGELTAALGLFFTLLLASVAPAAIHSGWQAAAASLARVALFGISVYVFFYTAYGPGRREGALAPVYCFAVASAVFACVDFYFQFPAPAGYGPQFVWLDSGVYRRAQGIFYEASTLGNFCAFFLVMIAVAMSRPRGEIPVSRKALLAGGAAFFAALVLSYSRGSLVNLAVALGVLAWRNRARLRLVRAVAILAAAALATWKVFPAFAEMYWFRLSASAEYFFSATEGVLSGRVASWRTLADWVTANPWQLLAGIGYKTLPYTDYLGAPIVADNMYLSLLVETGIAGLLALLWLNVAVLRAASRAARANHPRKAFYGTWMLCFWAGQVVQMLSGDLLTYWRVLPLYFWVLALAVRD